MDTLLNRFDENIKTEHNDIYVQLKRSNRFLLWINKLISKSKWYHHFLLIFILMCINLIFSFDFSSIPLLEHLNFIKLDENYVDRVLHEYTLYIGTFISITLIATTFLFNFLKEIMDSNIKLIVKYVNYEIAAYFGFSLMICLIMQKLISQSLSLEEMKNLVIMDFYLIVIFVLSLLRLYTKIFEIIKPTKLKELYLNDTKKICSQSIFHELYEIKSKKIFKDVMGQNGFIETSNSNYFFGDGPEEGINYLFNTQKGKYLKNINFTRLFKQTKSFVTKQYVPIHFGQFFNVDSNHLLLAFEANNKKFEENKILRIFNISLKKINEYLILNSYKFTKNNVDKSIVNDELDEKLEFLFDDLNDSVYKRNQKGVKKALNDLEVIIDLYAENFE